jgi:hypothetical protein
VAHELAHAQLALRGAARMIAVLACHVVHPVRGAYSLKTGVNALVAR